MINLTDCCTSFFGFGFFLTSVGQIVLQWRVERHLLSGMWDVSGMIVGEVWGDEKMLWMIERDIVLSVKP